MVYFGTDGIRGVVGKDLTTELAFKCGLALTKIKENPKILICKDTRPSNDLILFSLVSGAISNGGIVDDIGIAPTSVVSCLVSKLGYDYGVVISASHNPKEYNGIKIFNEKGEKISESTEQEIESYILGASNVANFSLGHYRFKENLQKKYVDHIISNVDVRLNGLKVVLDLANGASFCLAPKIFSKLGAEVVAINNCKNGEINENCGSLHLDGLKKIVLAENANLGLAFDGDADRVLCVDENGNVLDGDAIVYILTNTFKKQNLLKNNIVVGTTQTNLKIEKKLKQRGINFVRCDVGDKFVIETLNRLGGVLGGEQSGHIIIKNILPTGDGILAGIKIMEVMKKENKTLKELFNVTLMPQLATNLEVKDKLRIKNSEELNNLVNKLKQNFDGRIIVRMSGTENKIRILVEGESKLQLKYITSEIVKLINKINI